MQKVGDVHNKCRRYQLRHKSKFEVYIYIYPNCARSVVSFNSVTLVTAAKVKCLLSVWKM